MADATVLYDEDCGLCRWTAERLRRWDRRRALRFVPLGSAEAGELLAGLSPTERWASWHLVDRHGGVRSGGAAVGLVLRRLPNGRWFAAVADRFPRLTDVVYRWVARHRDALGRLLGARACAVDPSGPRH
jgi:predicted DCC family thiol-disulfide oxidoreductase YuxK